MREEGRIILLLLIQGFLEKDIPGQDIDYLLSIYISNIIKNMLTLIPPAGVPLISQKR